MFIRTCRRTRTIRTAGTLPTPSRVQLRRRRSPLASISTFCSIPWHLTLPLFLQATSISLTRAAAAVVASTAAAGLPVRLPPNRQQQQRVLAIVTKRHKIWSALQPLQHNLDQSKSQRSAEAGPSDGHRKVTHNFNPQYHPRDGENSRQVPTNKYAIPRLSRVSSPYATLEPRRTSSSTYK
jgi:hypothetical protein